MCLARTHAPLASSGRARDSTPHGERSTDSGTKHARYLGTGCSDRWLPTSRTASNEHLPPQTNASTRCIRGIRVLSNAISRVSILKVPARFPGDFWPACDFLRPAKSALDSEPFGFLRLSDESMMRFGALLAGNAGCRLLRGWTWGGVLLQTPACRRPYAADRQFDSLSGREPPQSGSRHG